VFKTTTVSFVAQLAAVSKWLRSGHQSCCWNGFSTPFSFLPKLMKCW